MNAVAVPTSLIAPERSESWPTIASGQIPDFVDVFCLVGVNPDNERFVGWGYFMSTSEAPPWPACKGNVLLLASVRVPLKSKSDAGLKRAKKEGCDLLSETVWKNQDPNYVRFRNKLAEDLAFQRKQKSRGGITIERIDHRDFQQLVKGRRV
jgi:hypothetical protein